MRNKRFIKKLVAFSLLATMALTVGNSVYASTQALPNGTIINANGTRYLTDSKGEKYSGWFIDSKEDWYYFKESDKVMKTGWHQDDKDGYFYYLNLSDGKMVTGWNTIEGKEYFFQPVRDVGNYHFNSEQERWLYSINSKVPYGALYMNTSTPDGSIVDGNGAKIITSKTSMESIATSHMIKEGWVSENGKWYYYEADVMAKNKWMNLNGKWYYLAEDGFMVSNGWKEIGSKSYYFGSDGVMYMNSTTPDGQKVDNNGELIVSASTIDYSEYVGIYIDTDVESGDLPGTHAEDLNIIKIENGKVYGNLYMGSYYDEWIGDFRDGVPIVNNSFAIIVEARNHDGTTGELISHNFVTDTYEFSKENGKPIIKRNGNVFYKYNDSSMQEWLNGSRAITFNDDPFFSENQ